MKRLVYLWAVILLVMLPVLAPAETHPVVGVDVPRDIRVACEVKDDAWGAGVGKARYVVIVHAAIPVLSTCNSAFMGISASERLNRGTVPERVFVPFSRQQARRMRHRADDSASFQGGLLA